MTDFDFYQEMVYGKKHLNKLNYNLSEYPMNQIVEKSFKYSLQDAHRNSVIDYPLFTELGKDSHTQFHRHFYGQLNQGWEELTETYERFISEIVLPYLGLEEALVQKTPTFRVQLPDNVAVVVNHYDSDENHRHPKGEINFIYALTDMYDTNSVIIEKMPRSERYETLDLKAGECVSFNGNMCSHQNLINKTKRTRMSFDFRVLPLNFYLAGEAKSSVTTNTKYIEGGYYKRMYARKKLYIARDIWDKEKEKFNQTMIKYGVKDAWGVVDLFEKKMAEYAGSKYAVAVDCCTNALFLCLRYLEAEGEITVPGKTWVSVPCTIKHAGCRVKFEDREWSGAYQLKPYPIYDGAVRMKRGMYQANSFHCLSFHIRKHIPIGRGGMILTDDKEAYDWFRTVRYCGRSMSEDGINYVLYSDDTIKSLGWNMYMTPEQAARGIELLEKIADDNPDQESSGSCKDLSEYSFYQ